jgi:hypothetical protein
MTPTTDIVQKLWDLCHVVRDNESLRYQTSPCIPSRSQKCAKFVTLRSFETGANCLASTPKKSQDKSNHKCDLSTDLPGNQPGAIGLPNKP